MKGLRKFLRGFFLRKTADGKTRWDGFGLYLVVVLVLFWIGYRITRPQPKTPVAQFGGMPKREARAKIETERANESSATFTTPAPLRSSDPKPLSQSERTSEQARGRDARQAPSKSDPATDEGFIDTVRLANQQRPARSSAGTGSESLPSGFLDEGETGLKAERVTTGANPAQTGAVQGTNVGTPIAAGQPLHIQVGNLDPATLTVFSRPAASSPTTTRQSGYLSNRFLPLGHEFQVIFTDKVLTLDLEGLVRFQVVGDVIFNGRVQIPHGTNLYATASRKNVVDRVGFTVHTIVWRDGTQTPISGIAKDPDGHAGVIGYYHPRPLEADALSYLAPVALGLVEAQKSTMTTQSIGVGGAIQNTVQANPYNLRNEMLTAGQAGLQDQLRRRQEELDRRYQSYVEIRAGSTATIQLTAAVDLEARSDPASRRAVATTTAENPPAQPPQAALRNALAPILTNGAADRIP